MKMRPTSKATTAVGASSAAGAAGLADRRRARRARRRGGFTLIEAALATVIVGVGCVATLNLLAAGTRSNLEGAEMTTGVNLARNIRELTLQKKFTDLPALNGAKYQPPKDSRGADQTQFANWQQIITVQAVDPADITRDIVDSNPSALRITVSVTHGGVEVSRLSWYSFEANPT